MERQAPKWQLPSLNEKRIKTFTFFPGLCLCKRVSVSLHSCFKNSDLPTKLPKRQFPVRRKEKKQQKDDAQYKMKPEYCKSYKYIQFITNYKMQYMTKLLKEYVIVKYPSFFSL